MDQYWLCPSSVMLQMGLTFSANCKGGSYLLDANTMILHTPAKLAMVNAIHVLPDSYEHDSPSDYVNSHLWKYLVDAEERMVDPFNNILPFAIHFPLKNSDTKEVLNIKDCILKKYSEESFKRISEPFVDEAMIMNCENYTLDDVPITIQHIHGEEDYSKYIELMQNTFGFTKDPKLVTIVKEALFYPHNVKDTSEDVNYVYENYLGYANNTSKPVCIGRIVQLSVKYMQKFPELENLCRILENSSPDNEYYYSIIALGTRDTERHKGYGSAMVKSLINRVSNLGGKYIGLHCELDTVPFYEKLGFSSISKQLTILRMPK